MEFARALLGLLVCALTMDHRWTLVTRPQVVEGDVKLHRIYQCARCGEEQ